MFCTDISEPIALLFSSDAPTLLYYSHFPAVFVALLLGIVVYTKSKSLESKLLLTIAILFSLWNFIDLVNWANVDSRRIMMTWSFMNLTSVLITAVTLYFSYVYLERKEPSLYYLLTGFLLIFIYVLGIPTVLNIPGFDLTICEASQGVLLYYFYFLEAIFLLWIMGYFLYKLEKVPKEKRRQIVLFSGGVSFFLLSFFWGTLIGNLTMQWNLEQYGLFGMVIFMGFLLRLIVKYQAFNIRLLGAQALMGVFVILIGSQLFFIKSRVNLFLTSVTLVMSIIFAYFLIREVKKEVARKEELQKLTETLEAANKELRRLDTAKSEFISIASHQLRTPLTVIKGFVSLLLEGAYGRVPKEIKKTLEKVSIANSRLMQLVENLLNISRIESGRIQYQFAPGKIESVLNELVEMFTLPAREKNLTLELKLPKSPLPEIIMDAAKIREVISNLVDNSLKYTTQGGITISADKTEEGVCVVVEDTGMGIEASDLPHLFKKFERGTQAARVNVSSTGLGLYVGRRFVEAHSGTIDAASPGKGKGSTFTIVLPLEPKKSLS